ncbi:PepSY-associated TM helix domain-containing protein [Blastopirellula marina]|uniref:PepSY domain-containing protein n=1 Tax=Blastopirellula marina TaxID=124 RepID=A0A2S8GFJ1_9BACT|nr:PepSY-associated TM helix domain-containing protein [Blastopirellula marina]PQO43070.1 PepSY domain-containing protein [Blastopirellula marina]
MHVRFRRLWLAVHRWIGLTFGLAFVLLGLTGSLLVFDHAIDEQLYPELLLTEETGTPKPLQAILDAANAGYTGDSAGVLSPALVVGKPRVENGVWPVLFRGGTDTAPEFIVVYVDPYTAEVTGQRTFGTDPMGMIYRLHFRLLAGMFGGLAVGVIGIVVLISLISGVVLWWPLLKGGFRAALAIRGGSRFNYDLHKTTGIVTALFLLVITFSGVYMELPFVIKPVLEVVSTKTKPPKDLKSAAAEGRTALTADQAIEIAVKEFPGAVYDHLHPPEGDEGIYEVAFRQPGEVQSSFGRTQVYLDQYGGEVLFVHSPETFTATDTFDAWQFPLHNGEAFGLLGRWVVFCLGIVPAILYVTGFLLWYRRKKKKKPAVAETKQVAAETESLATVS